MLPVVLDAVPPTVAIWNQLNFYYLFFGTAAGVLVVAYMVYNIIRNRAKGGQVQAPVHHEEGTWGGWKTVVLTLVVTGSVLAFVEYQTFASAGLVTIPDSPSALHITVYAQQWSWNFTYPNGYSAIGNLTVPAGQITIINETSKDVTHSFFVPSLDVAKDAQPGRWNQLWFNATTPGVTLIRCKQLCGVGHETMIANLTVVTPAAYQKWYASLPTLPPANSTTSSISTNTTSSTTKTTGGQ